MNIPSKTTHAQTDSAACPYHSSRLITGDHLALHADPVVRDSKGVWHIRSYEAAKAILHKCLDINKKYDKAKEKLELVNRYLNKAG